MSLSRFDIDNATSSVHGYYFPRPSEDPSTAFERARAEAAAALRNAADRIEQLSHEQYRTSLQRACTRTPAGFVAQRDALENLMGQLEAVGIAVPGEDEGQWADAAGLSFAGVYKALGYALDEPDGEPIEQLVTAPSVG